MEKIITATYINKNIFDLKEKKVNISKFKRFKIRVFGRKCYDIDDGIPKRYYEYKGQYWVLDKEEK